MQFAIDYAKSRNIEKLMTCVTSNNISGKIFFSSMGFETLVSNRSLQKLVTNISMFIGYCMISFNPYFNYTFKNFL